jgi:hypothetical protein
MKGVGSILEGGDSGCDMIFLVRTDAVDETSGWYLFSSVVPLTWMSNIVVYSYHQLIKGSGRKCVVIKLCIFVSVSCNRG